MRQIVTLLMLASRDNAMNSPSLNVKISSYKKTFLKQSASDEKIPDNSSRTSPTTKIVGSAGILPAFFLFAYRHIHNSQARKINDRILMPRGSACFTTVTPLSQSRLCRGGACSALRCVLARSCTGAAPLRPMSAHSARLEPSPAPHPARAEPSLSHFFLIPSL
jgi:hypothetical protein